MKRVISFILFLVCFFSFNSILVAQAIEEKAAGRIISLSGSVTVTSGTASSSAKPFQNLNAGDIVSTGPNSRAAILLRDESLVKLNANSRITIKNVLPAIKPVSTGADKTKIQQDAGEMWIRTKTRPGEMEIDTKAGSAAIRGTEFIISTSDDKTLLTVFSGQAELLNPLGTVLVAQNEQGEATLDSAPTKRTLSIEETENATEWIFYFPPNLKLEEQIDTDLETLTKYHDTNPESAEAGTLLGIKKLTLGKYEEALDLFNSADEINPDSSLNHLMRARTLFVLHRQEEALSEINEAIKLDPEWYFPHTEKSKFLLNQGDLIKAEKEANEAVKSGSDYPEPWIALGEIQYAFGYTKKASESFEKALAIDSNLAEAHIGKGKTLISQFYNDEAINEFLAAVLLDPNYARAHMYLGQAYYQNKESKKGVHALQEAQSLDPKDPLILNSLSIIYDVAHRYAEALELDQKTIAITPNLLESGARQSRNLSVASGNLGIQPLRFGLSDWAFFQANKALRENPIDGAGHFTVGTIYNSNDIEPLLPKGDAGGAAQAQLSTGQIRGLRGTTLNGINARTSTNEFDLGFNFASDSERTVGRLLTPSILGSPNGKYRFFRAKELYVSTNGLIGQQQISFLREGDITANGYLGTPWNFYTNTQYKGGLVRDVFGDLTGKGNRSFLKSDFAFSPHKTLDVIGSYTRADVNLRVFDKNTPKGRSLFTPDLNLFDVALNWHPNTRNVVLNRFFGEITSTRLDQGAPELGDLMLFAGIFPRNYGYQLRYLNNYKKNKFTAGGEWIHSNNPSHVSLSFLSMGVTPTVQTLGFTKARSEYDIVTAYFQDLYRFTKKTDFVLGLRYNQIFQRSRDNTITQTITDGMSSSIFDEARKDINRFSLSPQTGVVYNIGEDTTIRLASQHKSFYNTFLPELAPQDVGGLPFSNQNEFFGRGTEGWEHAVSFEHKLSFAPAFVRVKPFYRRMQVRDFDELPGLNEVQSVRNWGFEVGYNHLLWKQIGFFANYVYQHVRDRTKYKLFDDETESLAIANGLIPVLQVPHRIRFGWTWNSPTGLTVNYIHTYIGRKFGDLANSAANKINGYFLGDLSLSYESPRTRSYQLTFGINNIYGAAFRQTLRQRDPGVTFYGNMELRGVVPLAKHFWK